MKNKMQNKDKKLSRAKYIIPALFVLLFIIAGLIYKSVTWTPVDSESKKKSEAIIRQAAAAQLTTDPNNPIDPNELNDEDFAQIIELRISQKELTDIELLEKFTNLQNLNLYNIHYNYCWIN